MSAVPETPAVAHALEPALRTPPATEDPAWVRLLALSVTLAFVSLMIVAPAVTVMAEALRRGLAEYLRALVDPETLSAVGMTLLAALVSVPINAVFGISAAWAITRFQFPGKRLLVAAIDLPFAVSPVIAGMVMVLLLGSNSWLGGHAAAAGIKIIFGAPGIILATCFITFPFVARELIPFMEAMGTDQEEAAVMLGASGWQTFFRITLPNIKWGLLYGVILSNARAMGEFGAVSVVSGHIRGETNTLPLHVEILYNEYKFSASFAVASLLLMLAFITLVARRFLELRVERALAAGQEVHHAD